MSVRDLLLPDFDQEMAATRLVLARVPEAAFAWRPHEKSFGLGGLATHIAQIPRWGEAILDHDFYDLAESGGRAAEQTTLDGVLGTFDRHVRSVRARLLELSDAELMAPWTLRRGTHAILSVPRLAAFRRYLLHHIVHHRGQLTVYLRLQNVPLPPLYGPTADDEK